MRFSRETKASFRRLTESMFFGNPSRLPRPIASSHSPRPGFQLRLLARRPNHSLELSTFDRELPVVFPNRARMKSCERLICKPCKMSSSNSQKLKPLRINIYRKRVGGWAEEQPVIEVVGREKAVAITALFAHNKV
jgi:hypothetical protein